MKKIWPLVALGIGAYVLFALLTLPAELLMSQLASSGIRAAGVSGTAWNGRAQVLQVGGINVGAAQWDLHVLPLLAGRLKADVKITRIDGFAEGTVTAMPSGSVTFDALTASLPLSALPPNIVPGGWTGTVNLRFARFALNGGWPVDADGTIEVVDVTGPARRPVNMGGYKVTYPAKQPQAPQTLAGTLTDSGGPLQVNGTLQLKANRSYLVKGLVATRKGAPADINKMLQYLGPPDAQGRREFVLEGTL